MIALIEGEPGAGKTYFIMRLLELLAQKDEQRPIVAFSAINTGALNALLQKRYGSTMAHRLKVLPLNQLCRKFYTERFDQTLQIIEETEEGTGYKSYNLDPRQSVDHGVIYILDEVHNWFRARDWNKTGGECLWYLSQHRQMGDDIYMITQNRGNLDVGFTRLAEKFILVTNCERRKFHGMRLWRGFRWDEYPDEPAPGDVSQDHGYYQMDLELAKCYTTAAAARSMFNLGDTKRRERGPQLLVVLPLVLLAIGAAMFFAPQAWRNAMRRVYEKNAFWKKGSAPSSSGGGSVVSPPSVPMEIAPSPAPYVPVVMVPRPVFLSYMGNGQRHTIRTPLGRVTLEGGTWDGETLHVPGGHWTIGSEPVGFEIPSSAFTGLAAAGSTWTPVPAATVARVARSRSAAPSPVLNPAAAATNAIDLALIRLLGAGPK